MSTSPLPLHEQILSDVAGLCTGLQLALQHAANGEVARMIEHALTMDPRDKVLQLAAQVEALETRRDELLAAIRRLTVELPYPDEIQGWTEQRAKLIAEIGTLRAQVMQLRQDRADALNVRSREGLLASEWVLRTGVAERERDAALRKITRLDKLVAAARRCRRGCTCDYDDRCNRCQAVLDLQAALTELGAEET